MDVRQRGVWRDLKRYLLSERADARVVNRSIGKFFKSRLAKDQGDGGSMLSADL